MKKIFAITAVLGALFFMGCDNTNLKQNDLGIIGVPTNSTA